MVVTGVACGGCGRLEFALQTDAAGDVTLDGDAAAGDGSTRTWWNAAWNRRMKLLINNPGAVALESFPLLVTLNSTRIDFADVEGTLAADLRFIDADHTTVLPYEIEKLNTANTRIWVRVPRIEASPTTDAIWLYYGNAAAPPGENAAATWSGHALVWHLADSPNMTTGDIRDSTENNNAGTSQGAMGTPAQGDGVVAGSLGLDGVDDWFTAPSDTSLRITGDLTIQMWINRSAARNEWLCDYVVQQSEAEADNHAYELSLDDTDNINLAWEYNAGAGESVQSSVPIATGLNTWTLLTITRDSAANVVRFYENGLQIGSPRTYVNDATGGTASSLFVGGEVDPNSTKQPFAGRMDEVRIEATARQAAWVRADYLSMTDALITYNAPEAY